MSGRALRAAARALRRAGTDLARGERRRTARPGKRRRALAAEFPARLVERQPIRRTEQWENKVENLRRAAARIEGVAILPGERFSFWALVGPPWAWRGFRESRSLVAGRPVPTVGGGLCQLSGIVHALALRAGLAVRERHAHSVDLYDDATRFAPLGADATVAWGTRDLRLENTLGQPVCFRFTVSDDLLEARLCAAAPVAARAVVHRVVAETAGEVEVETFREEAGVLRALGRSRYRRARGEP